MPEIFKAFLSAAGFIPHGHCYLWNPGLVWLHVMSDSLTALAYYSIPVMLVYFVRKRRDVPFDWIFLMFGTFIVACGTTHVLDVWTLWHPTYWLSGFVKAITALVSLCTAVLLFPLIPKALALPSPAQLEAANLALRNEITQRQLTEEAIQQANEQLEIRVQERTAELAQINESLEAEIADRKQVEVALRRSEQRFRAIFNQAAVGIIQTGIDGSLLLVNQKFGDIVGYTCEELLQRTTHDITYPDDHKVDLKYIRQMVTGEISTNSREKRYIRKDGAIVWINLTVSLIRNSSGEPKYLLGVVEDISDRKRAEQALRESENRLRTIIDAEPECVKVVAPDGSLLEMNRAGLVMIEVDSAEEVIGQSVYSLVVPEYREAFQVFNQRICQGYKGTLEFEILGCKGTRRWMETHAVPMSNQSDGTLVQLAITRDITERKRAQEALQNLVAGTASVVGEKFFNALVQHLAAAIGVRYALVTEVLGGQLNRARTLAFWASGQLGDNFEYDLDNAPCQLVTNQRKMYYYPKGVQALFPQNQTLVEMQAECYLGIPLFDTSQQIIGHLCVLDDKPLVEEERTQSIMSIFAARAAAELERKRIEEERERLLRQLEQERNLQQATLTQLKAVLHQMPAGVIIAEAPSGRLILSNQQVEQIWPHPFLASENIEQYQEWKSFHLDGRPYQPQEWPLARSISTGEVVTDEEFEILRSDSTRSVLLVSSTPILDSQGSIIAAVETSYDITERKQTEEALRQSEERLRLALQNMPVMMDAFDANWNIMIWNRECERVTGYSAQEIVGNPRALELLYPNLHYRQQMIATWSELGQNYRDWEWETTCKDGSVKLISWSNISQQVPIPGWVSWGVGVDITDRKRAEQEIIELNENLERRVIERTTELEAANRELEAFSYSVSHDLRAPLRGIDGFSQALLERYTDELDDKGKHYLQRIRVGTQRMGELIDDLLKLSRVTRSEMRRTRINLSALAQELATELQQTQPERKVEWAIAPGLLADGDARLLRVALENLLNNAWKFTSSHIHSRIEFNVLRLEDAKLAYFVRDNGAGFDMAYAHRLFGAFVRLHNSTQFPGTGIGLATVQRIIHRHGGRVWAEGAVEQGSTFYFTL